MTVIYIAGLIIASVLCLLFTPIVKWLAIKMGAVDTPNARKVHQKVMPRMGGLAIYLAYSLTYVGIVFFTDAVATNIGYAILFGGLIIVLTGIIDDMIELSAKYKLLGQLIASTVAIYFGLKIQYFTLPFMDEPIHLGWLGIPITIVWIIAITNAINLIDGLDGLASGVSAIAALALFVVSLSIGNVMTAMMSLILVGSVVGFLFFNFHPAKIFMGDSGSLFLGFFLSVISLLELKQATMVAFVIPILVMAVPISDTVYAMIRRKLKNQPMMAADKHHLHHCLLALGLSHRQAVLLIYGISACFAFLGVLVTQTTLLVSVIILVFYFIFFEIFAEYIGMMDPKHRPLLRIYKKVRGAKK